MKGALSNTVDFTTVTDREPDARRKPRSGKRDRILLRMLRQKRFWALLLVPLCLGLVALASANPQATERVYATGVYPVLRGSLGRLFSLAPFSISEILVIAVPLALVVYIAFQVVRVIRHKGSRRERAAGLLATLACIAGVGYGLFTLLCGLNYHRLSFAEISGLEVRPSSVQELADCTTELAIQANALREKLTEDDRGVMSIGFDSYHEASAFAQDAYRHVGGEYPELGGYTARPKPVLLSRGMSYLDITGIYIPFTFEPNVNVDVPDFWIPCTMMHELAHFKGFMREDEANFISYLACISSGNDEFDYSGTMLALIHSSNALYSADKELYWPVMELLSDGVRRDIAANSAYWKQFEGPVAEVSSAMNDVYLKSNRQENGVKSYGRMVDLVLAEYRERHGLS